MSPAAESIIGVNWGSSNFRAYRVAADGTLADEMSAPAGVAALDRAGMADMMERLVERWPDSGPIYASGMIGSNIGWAEVPYAEAPAGRMELAAAAVPAEIGPAQVNIIPGIACRRSFDGAPDILRGEEVELIGLTMLGQADGLVALPGTHTKWAWLEDGRIADFFTTMSGEIFDRLTAQGLLASIVEGEAADGPAFQEGVATGKARKLGLGTLLFGARARVVRGELLKSEAAAYIRGLLIGSEIADALAAYPDLANAIVPLIGNGPLCQLYASALKSIGVASRPVDSREACLAGFRALHAARGA
ncbi:MAG TPA: 2-dehydro-3-deoxygalactonokinase [Sphingomonas sp.]|uniref:2-dehydro-3-deoxygalactonokinase n=1 Tax=Sphingomonas sp. TaxID=28214 RepID=UPI002B6042E2|nr:2-dehydro-3-deoxygalactonokinase [Sphingomonas sp.]HMI18890.1 2-dehydro-3-deoxygalactonokinase [Sphingomonas sp.]